MRLYRLAVALLGAFALLGCESLRAPVEKVGDSLRESRPGAPTSTLESLAERVTYSPEPADRDPLAMAAECLERGDRAGAANHLEAYVRLHPDQLLFRAQLAELFLRVGRDDAAKAHYERFAADAQSATGPVRNHLVNAHTRLMEIAQRADDRFAEVFHRGVGLLLLAREQEKLADRDAGFGEEMLCKAIKALAEAKELKPDDPRVRAYLAQAYDRAGNRRAADAERAAAKGALVPGQLTPTERKQVLLGEPRP
jgi:predicted Zn-dependent protease